MACTGKLLVLASSPTAPADKAMKQQPQGSDACTLVKCIDMSALSGALLPPDAHIVAVQACCHPQLQQAALFTTYEFCQNDSCPGCSGRAAMGPRCWCSALLVSVEDGSLDLVQHAIVLQGERAGGIDAGEMPCAARHQGMPVIVCSAASQ